MDSDISYRNMAKDNCRAAVVYDTCGVNNDVITGRVSDTDCNNSQGTGLIIAKSFQTLNIDSE